MKKLSEIQEEIQNPQEISGKTISSYMKKASVDKDHAERKVLQHAKDHVQLKDKKNSQAQADSRWHLRMTDTYAKKFNKRHKGLESAHKAIERKEEKELPEDSIEQAVEKQNAKFAKIRAQATKSNAARPSAHVGMRSTNPKGPGSSPIVKR